MCDKDLKAIDDLCERDASIALPVLEVFRRLNEHDEIILLALVVDFGHVCLSGRHLGGGILLVCEA